MSSIPVFDTVNQAYYEMAGAERLEVYGEFAHIDFLALHYTYTHEQVFKLSWTECMTMIAFTKEKAYVEQKADEIQRAADKTEK